MINDDSIIADTGFIYALLNENDPHYFSARRALEIYNDKFFITTCFVFAEIYWLLRKKHFHLISNVYDAFGSEGIFKIIPFETSQLLNHKTHSVKYSDRKIDIADASLISLAENIGHGNILTVDSDFQVYRWNRINYFNNLLLDLPTHKI